MLPLPSALEAKVRFDAAGGAAASASSSSAAAAAARTLVHVHHGASRTVSAEELARAAFVVTTYETLRADFSAKHEVAGPLLTLEAALARDPDSKEVAAALDAAVKKLIEVPVERCWKWKSKSRWLRRG